MLHRNPLSEEKQKQTIIYLNVYWNMMNNRDSQMFLSPIFFRERGICTQAMYLWENWCWSLLGLWRIIKHLCYRGCLPETGPGCKLNEHLLAQLSFQLAPKAFWRAKLISQFFCYSNSSKNITCLSGKLKTEFTSPKAKSTSPGLSDTTFFARRGQTCSSNNSHRTSWLVNPLEAS